MLATVRCKQKFSTAVTLLVFCSRAQTESSLEKHVTCMYRLPVFTLECTPNVLYCTVFSAKTKYPHDIQSVVAHHCNAEGTGDARTIGPFEFLDAAAFACTAPLLERGRFMACVLYTHTTQLNETSTLSGSRPRNAGSRVAALEAVVPGTAAAAILSSLRAPHT